jgi:DNA-binding IclR family transcriptional regulator
MRSVPSRRRGRQGSGSSGVGVLDRTVAVLSAVESGARALADVADRAGVPRPTAHRLLRALEVHRLIRRSDGGYALGPALIRLGSSAARGLPLVDAARPALERLTGETGESSQLFVRVGDERVCVEAVESPNELRTIVPVGASLPLTAGSAAKVFLAHAEDADRERLLRSSARPDALRTELDAVRRRGWAHSAGERQAGVGSVSAPVRARDGHLIAIVSVSGPMSRMRPADARRHARRVLAAAAEIEAAVGEPRSR